MEVIQAKQDQIPAVLEVWKELMDFHAPFDPVWVRADDGEERMGMYLKQLIEAEDALLLIAVEEEAVLGYAIAKIQNYPPVCKKRTYGLVSDLAVRSGYRRRGIGALLLEEMLAWFRFRGLDRVELRVASRNAAAYSFWRKHGFRDYVHELYRDLAETE